MASKASPVSANTKVNNAEVGLAGAAVGISTPPTTAVQPLSNSINTQPIVSVQEPRPQSTSQPAHKIGTSIDGKILVIPKTSPPASPEGVSRAQGPTKHAAPPATGTPATPATPASPTTPARANSTEKAAPLATAASSVKAQPLTKATPPVKSASPAKTASPAKPVSPGKPAPPAVPASPATSAAPAIPTPPAMSVPSATSTPSGTSVPHAKSTAPVKSAPPAPPATSALPAISVLPATSGPPASSVLPAISAPPAIPAPLATSAPPATSSQPTSWPSDESPSPPSSPYSQEEEEGYNSDDNFYMSGFFATPPPSPGNEDSSNNTDVTPMEDGESNNNNNNNNIREARPVVETNEIPDLSSNDPAWGTYTRGPNTLSSIRANIPPNESLMSRMREALWNVKTTSEPRLTGNKRKSPDAIEERGPLDFIHDFDTMPPIGDNKPKPSVGAAIVQLVNSTMLWWISLRKVSSANTIERIKSYINNKVKLAPVDIKFNAVGGRVYVAFRFKWEFDLAVSHPWEFGIILHEKGYNPNRTPGLRYQHLCTCDSWDFPDMLRRVAKAFARQMQVPIVLAAPTRNQEIGRVELEESFDWANVGCLGRIEGAIEIPPEGTDKNSHAVAIIPSLASTDDDSFDKIHIANVPPHVDERKFNLALRQHAAAGGFPALDVAFAGIQRNKDSGATTSFGFLFLKRGDLVDYFLRTPLQLRNSRIVFSPVKDSFTGRA